MNWDAIGAIGEIIGALAVVVSLLYLATQIRISNNAARQSRTQDLQAQMNTWYKAVCATDEMWSIWVKGCTDDPTITDNELGRFRVLLLDLTQIFARFEEQRQISDVDDWAASGIPTGRKQIVCTPGFRRFWNVRKSYFSEQFQTIVEDEMKSESTYYPGGVGEDRLSSRPDGTATG